MDVSPQPPMLPSKPRRRWPLFPLGLLALLVGGAVTFFGVLSMGMVGLALDTADGNGEFFALRRNHPQEYRAKMHEATRLKWETRLITFGGVALGSAGLALMVMAPTKRAPKAERPDEAPSPTGGT